jgi:putative FmdB family regulatory protein
MPIFEFVCSDCDEHFEVFLQGAAVPTCPACQGANLKKQLSVFAVSAGSPSASSAVGPCGTCGDPRGPGSCSFD